MPMQYDWYPGTFSEKELKVLRDFIGFYFCQDSTVYGDSTAAVIETYITEHGVPSEFIIIAALLERLADSFPLHYDEMDMFCSLTLQFRCQYVSFLAEQIGARDWLRSIAAQLRAAHAAPPEWQNPDSFGNYKSTFCDEL